MASFSRKRVVGSAECASCGKKTPVDELVITHDTGLTMQTPLHMRPTHGDRIPLISEYEFEAVPEGWFFYRSHPDFFALVCSEACAEAYVRTEPDPNA